MSEELARHGYRINPGSLYPTLHKIEEQGLLASHHVVVEGRPQRSYRAARAGRKALDEAKGQRRELAWEILGPDGR